MHFTKKFCKVLEETKEAHSRLEKTNKELNITNEKLKTTLSQLEKTNHDLSEALRTRELFIASVSHELRNPLNSMLGNIELLTFDVKDPKMLKMLETCKICGEVLLGLINNVLDVAKINAERLELNYHPTNFFRLIGKVWSLSCINLRQKGLKGQLYISRDFPKYVEIDAHRLNQILLNLIGNATKFTKDGFVKVIISWHKDQEFEDLKDPSPEFSNYADEKATLLDGSLSTEKELCSDYKVRSRKSTTSIDSNSSSIIFTQSHQDILLRSFSVKTLTNLNLVNFFTLNETETNINDKLPSKQKITGKEKGIIKIEIIDSGCGISGDAVDKLFQPFSQADPSITRRFGGTGLGLYITKQLVQKMEGNIYVYSQAKVGSDFCMLLPVQTVTNEEVKEKLAEEDNDLTKIKVFNEARALVVDDDPLNQIIMTNYLNKLQIHPEIANNGQEAVKMFKEKGFNYYSLITMDIQMPVMDGLTACKEIRKYEGKHGAQKPIPIIFVTGNCTETEKNACLDPKGEIKASYFFRKPFIFDECKSCVKTLLNKSILQDTNTSQQLRVLIIDNDPLNSLILKQYIEKFHFVCETSTNGKEAVKRATDESFDVVLMDCEMREMNGYSAARSIKAKNPDIMIIGITDNLREECLTKAKANGMNHIETKPVNFKRLIGAMRSAYTF